MTQKGHHKMSDQAESSIDIDNSGDDWSRDVDAMMLSIAGALDSLRGAYLAHLVRAGGRKFRRILLYDAVQAAGAYASRGVVTRLATGIELLHLGSLIHDDYADAATQRRGVLSRRDQLGDETILLLGVGCVLEAGGLIAAVGHVCLVAFTAGVKRVAQGQLRDIGRAHDQSVTIDEYVTMLGDKTGALLATAIILGATTGRDLSGTELAVLESVGTNLGVAFQIADDLEEFHGLNHGKPAHVDDANGLCPLALQSASSHTGQVSEVRLLEVARTRLQRARDDWYSVFDDFPVAGSAVDNIHNRLARVES